MRESVSIILQNKEGKILMQLRDNKPNILYPNCWGFFGGSLKKGETPEEGIKREIKEEINYNLKNYSYIGEFIFGELKCHIFLKKDFEMNEKDIVVKEGQKCSFFSINEIKIKKDVALPSKIILNNLNSPILDNIW